MGDVRLNFTQGIPGGPVVKIHTFTAVPPSSIAGQMTSSPKALMVQLPLPTPQRTLGFLGCQTRIKWALLTHCLPCFLKPTSTTWARILRLVGGVDRQLLP